MSGKATIKIGLMVLFPMNIVGGSAFEEIHRDRDPSEFQRVLVFF
jgi:hypothetical protein